MRSATLLIAALMMSACAIDNNSDYVAAIRNGAEAKFVYRIIQEDGSPVCGANAHVWFRSYGRPQDNADWRLASDTNGLIVVSHRVNESFSISVEKDFYYTAREKVEFLGSNPPSVLNGKWQPYGQHRELTLKKIKHLGCLRVLPKNKRMGEWKVPFKGEWLPFDLEKMDWVTPVGKGDHSDMLVRISSAERNFITDYSYKMEICFTNTPYAGAYIRKKDSHSDLQWSAMAETNEMFQSTFSYIRERNERGEINQIFLPRDCYLVYRTRSKVDEHGNLKSIHYGVVSGEWGSGSGTMNFEDAIFNPTENDPALEDGIFLREKYRQVLKGTRR